MPKLDLNGTTAIVTGAGSGINLAFAKALHAKGVSVLIADISLTSPAQEFLSSIPASSPAKAAFQKTDVSDWTQLDGMFDAFAALNWNPSYPVPDIVCPGAGIYEPSTLNFWADNDPASHYKVLDINLLHPLKTTRIAVRRMLRAQRQSPRQPASPFGTGVVVHISSIGAQTASIVTPLYQASKHGVSSFIRGMAPLDEMVGIRVVGVAPGVIGTPLFFDSGAAKKFLDMEKDFMLPPEEVARGMVALCENSEKYPAGTVLEVADEGEEKWRKVNLLNDPGPQGRATKVSRKDEAIQLIRDILEKDAEGE